MNVGILATGKAESEGVPGALKKLFGHEFPPIFMRDSDREPFGNIYSPASPISDAHTTAVKIVQRVAAELERREYDYIVILDDLEVVNLGRSERVIEHMRLAVRSHLARAQREGWSTTSDLVAGFRERVSFHLAVPMLEAWFFADPGVLADLAVNSPPRLAPRSDPEAFTTDDPEYANDDCSACAPWQGLPPAKRKLHRPAWAREHRVHHPKAYLSWLMKDPREKGCSRYQEIKHGVRALDTLNWATTLRRPDHYHYLRAFLDDLSIALDVPLPWLDRPAATVPTRYIHGDKVLRNV